jgi:uncharacterized protein
VDRLFLDANVLFSAAYREGAGLTRLWRVDGVILVSSEYALEEARRNLREAAQLDRLQELADGIELIRAVTVVALPADIELPEKDRPILWAALTASATHLLTGDIRHFGAYFGREVVGVRILPPADYLRERRRSR